MDVEQWLFNVSSVVVGGLLTIGTHWFATYWQTRREDEAGRRKRSKEAAERLLDLVDDAYRLFDNVQSPDDVPDIDDLHPTTISMERETLVLDDEMARRNVDRASQALLQMNTLLQTGNGKPGRIAYIIRQEVRATLGAHLRNGKVSESESLAGYDSDIHDYWDW